MECSQSGVRIFWSRRSELRPWERALKLEKIEDRFWQELWRLEAPAVVKNFMWKVGNDLLPTKGNLFQKNIVQNPNCPICLQETEDMLHILWSCKSSMAVWQECGKKIQKLALGETDGKGLLQYLMRKLEGEDLLMAIVVSCMIWLRRNAVVFDREFTPPGSLVADAQRVVREFTQPVMSSDLPLRPASGSAVTWTPPRYGTIKINWAAILNHVMKQTGIGVLIRNANGELLATQAKFFSSLMDSSLAAALGAWYAVKLGCDMGAHLEGATLSVVAALKKNGPCGSSFLI
ncbi:uncharacterized protein LOC133880954 [Alnus glutinosa]|uniref:uncharacterized protein LOC133880954 n=1 Tax=Alnus glutinosa TaxID=3517 RepID=UPI002D7991CF|nr:uncharacterized protein LOC133880954 [Alnus glutinosa]